MSDSFVVDGSLIVLPVVDGRFQDVCWMRAVGQLPPFDDSGKQSSEGLLHSETCRKTNSQNSAIAAGRALQRRRPVWNHQQPYAPRAVRTTAFLADDRVL